MFKKIILSLAFVAMLGLAQTAQASLTLTDAELLAQTPVTFGSVFGPIGSMATSYSDSTAMAGAVGVNTTFDPGGFVNWGIDGTALARINTALSAGADSVTIAGYNDNDDVWLLGLYATTATTIESISVSVQGSTLGPPNSAVITLSGLSGLTLTSLGVSVEYATGTGRDTSHASWRGVPEPGSIVIWSMIAGLGFVGSRRRRV